MKKIFNKTLLFGILVGLSFSTIGVYAATKYMASDIKYKDTIVEKALNDLYENLSQKYVRYNEETKDVEVYNSTLNKYIAIKHYSQGLPLNGILYLNGTKTIDFEEVDRTTYGRISHEMNEDHILLLGNTNGGGGGIFTAEKVDLTVYSKLTIEGVIGESIYPSSSHGIIGTISNEKIWGSSYLPSTSIINSETGYTVGDKTLEIDISSLNGKYYIGVGINQCEAKITRIELS